MKLQRYFFALMIWIVVAVTPIGAAHQTATFNFGQAIPVGSYKLLLEYTGRIGTRPVGRARALYTQFAG